MNHLPGNPNPTAGPAGKGMAIMPTPLPRRKWQGLDSQGNRIK
jgi:hypothetical protein